ncbi:hypothetical protein M433DRAFT_511938 [Acidomyces richmondensis BFW]|nr:hypothetical protein M433DRAFT_511938 [Acidomyces richmondensis BFW]
MNPPSKWPSKKPYIHKWFHSLASALKCMHGASFRHKDIKPAKILVCRDNDVALTDFGTTLEFSSDSSDSTGNAIMTPKYCVPEVARRDTRGRSADIFSLGCVFLS